MTTHDYTQSVFCNLFNPWNLCGKIIPLLTGLEGFCHLPSGFCPGLWQEPKGGTWKRCWVHRPGPWTAGGQWNMILQLILKWDTIFLLWKFHIFMKFRFVLSFSTKSYWRVPAIEHIEPGAMFFVRGHEFALGHVARPQRWIVWCASLSKKDPPASLIRPFKSLFILGVNGWQPQLFIF